MRRIPGGAAGLRTGDKVVAINGRPVDHWEELEDAPARANGRALEPHHRAGRRRQKVTVTPRKVPVKPPFREPAETWNIGAGPYLPPVIGEVRPGMPAGRRASSLAIASSR